MKYLPNLLISGLALSLVPFIANADDDSKEDDDSKKVEYVVNLQPLNNSGVWAKAEMKLKGNKLKVEIEATGMETGKPHPQHIHGFGDPVKNSSCPGFEADVNGDGVVSVGEGGPSYGPIVLPLVPFDLVDESGKLEYEVKLKVNAESLGELTNRTIVMHGLTVNGSYVNSLPVACGQIENDDD